MEAKMSGNNLVIKMNVGALVGAFNSKEENQDAYKIDPDLKVKFAKGVCEYLNQSDDSETELTKLQTLLDEIFDEMIENDEMYVLEIEEEE